MYNKVVLLGRLTKEIDIRYAASGLAIGNTGIAVSRKWKDKQGNTKEETLFIDISFYGKQAEHAIRYLKKGSKIMIDGRLILQQWVAQDGTQQRRHKIDVESFQMLDCKEQGGTEQKQQTMEAEKKPEIPEVDVNDEDIPF